MSGFELNHRNIEKFAKDIVRDAAKDTQMGLDRVYSTHRGASVDQIEHALQRELRNGPVNYDKATIRGWAELIANNTRIQLRAN